MGNTSHIHLLSCAIDDWFDHNGSLFEMSVYESCNAAYKEWEEVHIAYLETHLRHTSELKDTTGCACGAEPARPIYSTDARKPRLVSEVLASVVENEQAFIDYNDKLPIIWHKFVHELVEIEDDEEARGKVNDKKSSSAAGRPARKTRKPLMLRRKREESTCSR